MRENDASDDSMTVLFEVLNKETCTAVFCDRGDGGRQVTTENC